MQRGELVASLDTTEAQLSQAAKQAGGGSMLEWRKKKRKKINREQERDKHTSFRIKKLKSQQRVYLEAGPNQYHQGERKKQTSRD